MAYLFMGLVIMLGTIAFFWFSLPGPDGKMRPFLAHSGLDTWAAIAITMGIPLGIGGIFVGVLELMGVATR